MVERAQAADESCTFAGFRVDRRRRRLTQLETGADLPLTGKAVDVLCFLIDRPGELVTKAALLEAVWSDVVVEENSLNQCISQLRRAFGERPGENRFIATEAGRGYRFIAELQAPPSDAIAAPVPAADLPANARQWPFSATQRTWRASVAVMPFMNVTGDPSKDYLGDGLAEELINALTRVPGLRVPARTSTFAYRGRNVDVRRIASDLQVSAVLEGSVRSAADRIRVTAQLIDGQTGFHLWSETYDREFQDLFALQDDLAAAIVLRTLSATAERAAPSGLARKPPTQNLQAYLLYLQAVASQSAGEVRRVHESMMMLREVLRLDPSFSRARTAMAAMYTISIAIGFPHDRDLRAIEDELREALAQEPDAATVHVALGLLRSLDGRWVEAEALFLQAMQRDDMDPWIHHYYGMHVLSSAGHLREYLASAERADRLAPAWFPTVFSHFVANALAGRSEAARASLGQLSEIVTNLNVAPISDARALLAVRERRFQAASDLMVEALPPAMKAARGAEVVQRIYGALGEPRERAAAIRALDELWALTGSQASEPICRRVVVWYAMLGAVDQVFEILNRSLDQFSHSGTVGVAWGFLWIEELAGCRADPRFHEVLVRLKLFDYWEHCGPPDGYDLVGSRLKAR